MRLALRNATFITMCDKLATATACVIEDNKILWVGDERALSIPVDEVLDLQGAYVYPGFIDTHAHIFYEGYMKLHELRLTDLASKDEILERVLKAAQQSEPGSWIVGNGWDEHLWHDHTLPRACELDEVSPNNPVFLRRIDCHGAWVNSLALQIGGINEHTADPHGGKIYRDKNNKPTGILLDNAKSLLFPYMPKPEEQDARSLIKHVLNCCLELGITTICDASMTKEQVDACRELSARGELPVRISAMVKMPSPASEIGPESYGPFFEVRAAKFFIDGALGSRGACLFEPYADAHGESGLLLWHEKELLSLLDKARSMGFQLAAHAIGDRANHVILNAYQKVPSHRPRIEHAQLIAKDDIARFSDLGIIAAMQPLHMSADMHWVEKRLGKERAQNSAYLWRSLLDAGCIVAGGSDAPIVDLNPLLGIYTAITRQDLFGNPSGGWNAKECVTPYQALRMYTIDAAYTCCKEHERGSITPGKLADLCVLPDNILTCPPKKLLTMTVLHTFVDGKNTKVP